MIAIVVIAIGVCAVGTWMFFAQRASTTSQAASSRAGDFFKAPQDYKTSGGQKMKPRW